MPAQHRPDVATKVATIGEIVVEIMADAAGDGFREPIALSGPYPSGAPAIFIDQVARLGQPCGIVSCVGDDDFGRLNLDRLARDGVDVSAVRIHPDQATGSAFVRYRADGDRDFVFNIRHSACGHTAVDAAGAALLTGCGHLHVMGSSLFSPDLVAAAREAAGAVKARGGTVSFDPNVRKEMMRDREMADALRAMLGQADLFLPSGPELFMFAEARDEGAALAELLGRGVGRVVVKRGSGGASCHSRDGNLHAPAFPVEEVDPTGAGDCFGATFVTCWLRGMGDPDSLRYANAAGALAVGRRGPMEGTSTFAQLDAFIARHGSAADGGATA